MARAMAEGWIRAGAVDPASVYVCARHFEALEKRAAALGVNALTSAAEVVRAADWIIVAVKPYLVAEVLGALGEALTGKRVVSVAVGIHFEALDEMLPRGVRHVSILPNTPVAVGKGVIITEITPAGLDKARAENAFSPDDLAAFDALFASLGRVVRVETEKMGVAGIISGCGPAFAAQMMEALSDAAVKHGIPRAQSYELISQMLLGTAALQLATGTHPAVMKDAVTSPGGTTIAGCTTLERKGMRSAFIEAVDAVVERISK